MLLLFTHMPMRIYLDTFRLRDGIDRWYFATDSFQGVTPAQIISGSFMILGVWIFAKRRHIEPVKLTIQRLREEEAAKGIIAGPDDAPMASDVNPRDGESTRRRCVSSGLYWGRFGIGIGFGNPC